MPEIKYGLGQLKLCL